MQPMQEPYMTVLSQISRQANYSALQMNRSDWVYLDADQYKFCYERGHGMRGCPYVAQAIADQVIYQDETGQIKWAIPSRHGYNMRFNEFGQNMRQ